MRTELRRCYRIRELPDVAGDFQTLRVYAIRKAPPLVDVNELNRLLEEVTPPAGVGVMASRVCLVLLFVGMIIFVLCLLLSEEATAA